MPARACALRPRYPALAWRNLAAMLELSIMGEPAGSATAFLHSLGTAPPTPASAGWSLTRSFLQDNMLEQKLTLQPSVTVGIVGGVPFLTFLRNWLGL